MTETMYLCLGTARPSEKNTQYVAGKNYPVLVFALGSTVENAEALAVDHLKSTEWLNVVIDKAKPIDIEALNTAQPEVVNAYKLALKDGSHGMVFGNAN